jgi:D-glycero-alpha-D-manno-heptose-7-phosphate kinase
VQAELMLFYTGLTRSADAILQEQTANVGAKLAQLGLLRDLAEGAADALRNGDSDQVGIALCKSWEAKRSLASGVSNSALDAAVDAAMDEGATGAKVAGAGGGGFVLVVCPVQHQAAVRVALSEMKELPIKIDPYGSRVVLNVHRDIWG